MKIYMSHEKHGSMFVYLDDIEQKLKEGWIESEQEVATFQQSMKTNVEQPKRGRPKKVPD